MFFDQMLIWSGPKSNSVKMISDLRTAGMNIVRMNFSHGDHEVLNHQMSKASDVLSITKA